MKVIHMLGWFVHWFLQGLKLWIFAFLAFIFISPLTFIIDQIDQALRPFSELSGLTPYVGVTSYILSASIALALFTAILASMLASHPLRPYGRPKKVLPPSSSDSKEASPFSNPPV